MTKTKFFQVRSATNRKTIYTIRQLFPSGEYKCSCPFFVFNENKMIKKGLVPKCNHIRRVLHSKLKVSGSPIYKRRHYLEAHRQQFDYHPQE